MRLNLTDNAGVSLSATIRVAEAADLSELLALDHGAQSTPARQAFIRRAVMRGACHVALLEGRLLGCMVLDYTFFDNGFISLVYVAQESRRCGIGRALVQHAQRICLTPKLFTSTNASNMPMRNLLLGQGYQPSGMVEHLDEGDPEMVFFKSLPDRAIAVRLLHAGDETVLAHVAQGVFDHNIDPRLTHEFLGDPRHHLAVAEDNGVVVGMASAVHYVHPDKPPELWINEVGVAPTHQGRGLAKALLAALFEAGRAAGCAEAWVLTDRSNLPAMRLYASLDGKQSPNDQVMFTFGITSEKT